MGNNEAISLQGAFGKNTDGLFAMQLDLRDVSEYRSLAYLQEKFEGRSAAMERIMKLGKL